MFVNKLILGGEEGGEGESKLCNSEIENENNESFWQL